jgi:hypothetical protein
MKPLGEKEINKRKERREKREEGKSENSVPSCASVPTGLPYAAY